MERVNDYKLNQIYLHDHPVSKFEVDFKNENFHLVVDYYVDELKDYRTVKFIFHQVNEFKSTKCDISNLSDAEISNHNCLKRDNGQFEFSCSILIGDGSSSFVVTIVYEYCEIEGMEFLEILD